MTVPRKITTHNTGRKLEVYKEGTELHVGIVHKPIDREGLNPFPCE